MTIERFKQGDTDTHVAIFTQGIDGNTTADGKIKLYNQSTGLWWTDGTSSFDSATEVVNSMTKVSDVNAPGRWEYNFTYPVADTIIDIIMYDDNLSSDQNIFTAQAYVGEFIENLDAPISNTATEANATTNKNDIISQISSENDDAEAAAVGRAVYDPVTSILTLYKKGLPSMIHQQFNCKDENGDPAEDNPIFEKVPF